MRVRSRLKKYHKRIVRFITLVVFVLVLGVPGLLKVFYALFNSPDSFGHDTPPTVVVHFDLKGAPPTLPYLGYVLRHIKNLGADAILLEYEDMFPYEKDIENLSSPFHYQKADLLEFLQKAKDLGIEVIPLIQTFGHMEYVLKHKEFQHLREDPLYPDSICPHKNGSTVMLKTMIEQVILLHNYIAPLKRIHIGCDEVYSINKCPDCTKKSLSKLSLYIQHLKNVSNMVISLAPGIKILVWDDMFRDTPISHHFQKELVQLGSKYQIEPVVWDYSSNLSLLSHKHMNQYHKAFNGMWVASAYKGADGVNAVEPDLKNRLLNNLNWVRFVGKFTKLYNIKGIMLTGWSRYAHFQPLCELLPASYLSLTATLFLINKFRYGKLFIDETLVYTKDDWEPAFNRYFEFAFASIDACNPSTVIQDNHRPECRLNSGHAVTLHRHVVAYDDAINKQRDYIERFDLKARIKYNYVERRIAETFIATFLNLTNIIQYEELMVKEAMKHFFPENVCNEYITYKSYSAKQRQAAVKSLLKRYFKTKDLNHIIGHKGGHKEQIQF